MDFSVGMKTSKSKHYIPSFIKFFGGQTASILELPPAFVKKVFLEDGFSSKLVLLKIHTGKKWRVKIENDGNKYYFSKGWFDFVKDTKTETGDLLAFSLLSNSTFSVSIFGPNRSGKDLSYAIPTTQAGGKGRGENVILIEDEDKDEGKKTYSMEEMENPYIVLTIKKSHLYQMRLPKEFMSSRELGSGNKIIVLRNKEGKEWNAVIRRRTGAIYLTSFWFNFRKDNMIIEGNNCSFKYFNGNGVRHDFIQVDIVNEGGITNFI